MDRLHLSQHISQQFNAELAALTRQVLAMGGLVESQLATALEALAERDARRTADVIAREEAVNASELEIDARCTQILARRQPAASDLRLVLACVRMVTNLERIGDEAERIAKLSEKLGSIDLGERYTMKLAEMGSLVRDQLRGTLDTFARMDEDRALERLRRDREVDVLYKEVSAMLVDLMQRQSDRVPAALDLLWCARALERIGDRCKNLCEQVIYLVRGKDVRHTGLSRTSGDAGKG
ncbi:phosphate signaling complex protein PhoU [Tahibacter amnicola]|uniref:Phosphate-specific transport system accessory protein PhoU n=1 Tax=Tahibacter amnicola TaxID=2976241 RepID=A0ABY6BKK8_9GAMM|nr:phosphate signaling complex protein PhoU [Tahibacter amnicola]UXI69575.1 phosphate signaling complex protein PhoU [Tahibacter amnicola]